MFTRGITTNYGPLIILPANDAVRQEMLSFQEEEEEMVTGMVIPDFITPIKKEPNSENYFLDNAPKTTEEILDRYKKTLPQVKVEYSDAIWNANNFPQYSNNLGKTEATEMEIFDSGNICHQDFCDAERVDANALIDEQELTNRNNAGPVSLLTSKIDRPKCNKQTDTSYQNKNADHEQNSIYDTTEKIKRSVKSSKKTEQVKNTKNIKIHSVRNGILPKQTVNNIKNNENLPVRTKTRSRKNEVRNLTGRASRTTETSENFGFEIEREILLVKNSVHLQSQILPSKVTPRVKSGLINNTTSLSTNSSCVEEVEISATSTNCIKLSTSEQLLDDTDLKHVNINSVVGTNNVINFEIPSTILLPKSLVNNENKENTNSKQTEMKTKTFRCKICGKEFSVSQNYRKHVKIHTIDKPHQCDICCKTFSLLAYLKRHRSIHVSENNKLVCQYCFKKYPDATRLHLHQTFVHMSEDRKYSCDICSKSFKMPGALKEHLRIHSQEKEYACEICKMRFSNSANLIHHYKTHTNEKVYKCTFCERSFSRHRNLKSHFIVHTGEKSFKCKLCGSYFRTLSNLKQHELMHSGQKSTCNICGKCYSRPAYVRLHVARAHTKLKKYSCEMCSAKFFTTSELALHARSHTGELPFKCNLCPKAFIISSRLTEHINMHKKYKPFQCDRCALQYYTHRSLKTHIRNSHKG